MDGLEAIRRIARASELGRCKVLALTTFDVDDYVYTALASGASGFLLKEAPPEELLAAIRVVAAGDSLVSPASTRRLIERHTPVRQPVSGKLAELTAREQEVLRLVARGFSNAEVADSLHLSEGTVKTHVTHILGKLEVRDRLQAVVLAYKTGLVQPDDDGSSAAES